MQASGDGRTETGRQTLRIAVPTAGGRLAMHFGHCEQFVFVDIDMAKRTALNTEIADAPEHQPGLLPRWLAERGAQIVIAGGMGSRAQGLFAEQGIEVVVGAGDADVQTLVRSYMAGTLKPGQNICDH